jgi:hypothetical protein
MTHVGKFLLESLIKPSAIGEKYRQRQKNASDASRDRQAQRNHAIDVAKAGPSESPRVELLRAARSGDSYARRRADELYGSSWRKAVA